MTWRVVLTRRTLQAHAELGVAAIEGLRVQFLPDWCELSERDQALIRLLRLEGVAEGPARQTKRKAKIKKLMILKAQQDAGEFVSHRLGRNPLIRIQRHGRRRRTTTSDVRIPCGTRAAPPLCRDADTELVPHVVGT
jgi:hypothetical protein